MKLFAKVSKALAEHRGVHIAIARMQFMAAMSVALMRSVASIVLVNYHVATNAPLARYYPVASARVGGHPW